MNSNSLTEFHLYFTSQEVPHYMTQKVEKLENSIYLSSLYAQKITNMRVPSKNFDDLGLKICSC